MLLLNSFKTILILGGVLLLVILAIALSLTQPVQQPPSPQPVQVPVPTSFPALAPPSISPSASVNNVFNTYSEEYLKEQEDIDLKEKPLQDQALTVSRFIDKLPVTGKFIKVTYNIYNNQIYLEYPAGNKDESLKEFVGLLKSNGIENINWLYNLQIIER